ncbi:MAG: replicative DNA helicase [Gemmatimonadota bacterium]|nr:replicative DNA helicase [Gemmatimonadota bacterium]
MDQIDVDIESPAPSIDRRIATDRTPPHSDEAEVSVLGGMLLEETAVDRAMEILAEEDFYHPAHRRIFQAIGRLRDQGHTPDALAVREELKRRDELEEAGGAEYLARIVDIVPTAANVSYHAKIVLDAAVKRRLIRTGTEIVTDAYEGGEESDHLLNQAEERIFRLSEHRFKKAFTPINELLQRAVVELESLAAREEHITGVPTGYHDLDDITAGLQLADLVIVAARPSVGKTSLATCFAANAAILNDLPVAIFSLEMSTEQLVQRLISMESMVSLKDLRTGHATSEQWKRVADACDRLRRAAIYIDDTGLLTPMEMRAKARRLKQQRDIGMVIVDYLQLMETGSRSESRQQEITEISRSLKALAKELNIPVVALSQLSRAPEQRTDQRPRLSDLRECVTGDTIVVLADGSRTPIRELVGTEPEVLAIDDRSRVVRARADKVWSVGVREVFDVRLASGRRIRATGRHRLLTGSGWRRLDDIEPGDRLALSRSIPEPADPVEWPDARVALLGQLVGDGSYLVGQPMRYTTGSEANSELVARACEEEFGAEIKRYEGPGNWHQLLISGNGNRWHPEGVNAWLRGLGIFGQRSEEKRIPGSAFRLSDAQVALLLQHLWATDGTISPRRNGRGSHGVFFSTASEGLAGDVAALLVRLGIVARIRRVEQASGNPVYTVVISGSKQQLRFLTRVGAFGPRVGAAEELRELLVETDSNPNVDTLPSEVFGRVKSTMRARGVSHRAMAAIRGTSYGGSAHFSFAPSRATPSEYAEILDDDVLRDHASSDLFWDRVVEISPAGEEEVFDLTVPGPANWLADGIVSHNSGAIEQDADLVLFLYREKQKDEEGGMQQERSIGSVTEIIVGKNRNGPTGTVELVFLEPFMRFEDLDRHRS